MRWLSGVRKNFQKSRAISLADRDACHRPQPDGAAQPNLLKQKYMTDQETIARFIFLRSQGWSFNRIQVELQISKPTLIKWSRQHQFEIANLRATETEALAERVFRQRHERWEVLGRQLKRLEEEIEKRDLEEIPASRLHAIAAQLRAEINREMGRVHFAETTRLIPHEEFVVDRHEWSV